MENLPVGILASSALGSELTQTTLDTFHSAGIASGLESRTSRLQEIFNNTSTLNKILYTLKSDIEENIVYTSIKSLVVGKQSPRLVNIEQVEWIKDWATRYGKIEIGNDILISVCLCLRKQIKNSFPIELLATTRFEFVEPIAISPLISRGNDLYHQVLFKIERDEALIETIAQTFLDSSVIEADRFLFCFVKIWSPLVLNSYLRGMPGVESQLKVDGSTLLIASPSIDIQQVIHLDPFRITSNRTSEMLQMFGIEVARRLMIDELGRIMTRILPCHIQIIADTMTWSGKILSISRYTARDFKDALKKISFEEAVRNICKACIDGERDLLMTTDSRIVASKRIL